MGLFSSRNENTNIIEVDNENTFAPNNFVDVTIDGVGQAGRQIADAITGAFGGIAGVASIALTGVSGSIERAGEDIGNGARGAGASIAFGIITVGTGLIFLTRPKS